MPSIDDREQDFALHSLRSMSKIKTMASPEEQCDSGLSSMGPSSMGSFSQVKKELEAMDEMEEVLQNLNIDTLTGDSGVYNSVPYNSLPVDERDSTAYNQCRDDKMDNGSSCSSSDKDNVCTVDMTSCRRVPCPTMEQIIRLYQGDREGYNHLHLSIIDEDIRCALFLINNVPQYDWLSFGNIFRQTALHLAVLTRQPEIVRRLICAGAWVTTQDKQGDTPLHIACRKGYASIVRHLLTPVTYEETLQNTYSIPYQRVPQDLNIRNGDGETCLHIAARAGHTDIVQMLLASGGNINVGDGKSGRTVLHMAAESNDVELTELLLSCSDIIVNSKTFEGRTPLQLALGRNHTTVVSLICRSLGTGEEVTLSDFSDFEISDDDDMSDSDDNETSGYDSNMSGH